MNILVSSSVNTQHWQYFLNHFEIDHTSLDLFNDSRQKFCIPEYQINTCLVVDYSTAEQLYLYDNSNLLEFLECNKLLIVSNTDAPVNFRDALHWLEQLDLRIRKNSVYCIIECSNFHHRLANVYVGLDSESRFFETTEQRISLKIKKNIHKDFLLLMGREEPTRNYLWKQINNENLAANAITVYHRKNGGNHFHLFQGDVKHPYLWQKSLIPCVDLYSECAFEVAVETMVEHSCWFTEKTIRPIAAKTPFVLLSVPGALHELHKLGFKTFGQFIDESYDNEADTIQRTDMIVQVVNDIVKSGPEKFAHATQQIVDHNWNRLLELKGAYQHHKDLQYFDLLSKLNASFE